MAELSAPKPPSPALTQSYPPPAARTIVDPPRGPVPSPATTLTGRATVLPRVQRGTAREEVQLIVDERQRYEDQSVLGEGGAGVVHRANDNDIGRVVARKRIRQSVAGPEGVARFVDEIRLVGQLEHPNIIPIHDVGIDDAGEYFFVMKHVEGESLETIIARLAAGDREYHRRFPIERRVEIFLGILEAIQYAHSRRVLHLDIKPANVMVGAAGEVMVMDWGIARSLDAPHTAGEVIGTPLYMSPEQATGEPLDERSDVYSLCVLFHEMLCLRHYLSATQGPAAPVGGTDATALPETGEIVFGTGVQAVITGVIAVEAKHASFVSHPHQTPVPAELGWFAAAGLSKDKTQRFSSVAVMVDRLHACLDGRFPVQCPITAMKRTNREWLRFVDNHPFVSTGLAYGLLVAMLVYVVIRVFFLR